MNIGFIFDMDGVLVDTNAYHKLALQEFAQRYGYFINDETLENRIYGRTNKEWITNLFERVLTIEELKKYGEEKETIFRNIYQNHITPVDGVVSFIHQTSMLEIPMAIGTSAPISNLDFVLHHIPIRTYFTALLHESYVIKGKPDPEIYIKCAAALQLPPERCVVFEDSISGVEAAIRAGCKCVGVTTTHSGNELQTEIHIPDFVTVNPTFLIDQIFNT